MNNTCFFVGHREPPAWVRPLLAEAVERHITEYGVMDFLVGRYGGFDRMARAEVIKAKARHPGVSLYLMLPFLPKPGENINLDGCDGSIFPEGMETVPYNAAIPRLNQIAINESEYLIAYITHAYGGAYQTMEYAQRRERQGNLHIINLAETSKKPVSR